MFELSNEQTLMISDDKSVQLTTHRVIYQIQNTKRQMMLEDYEGYELKKSHIGNYKLLTIIFSAIAIVAFIIRVNEYFQYRRLFNSILPILPEFIFMSFTFDISLFLAFLSLVFFLISRRYYLRLNGKFDSMEIRITNPRSKSINHFLETLIRQSAEIKSQLVGKKHSIPG